VDKRVVQTFCYKHHDGWVDPEWQEYIHSVIRVERTRNVFSTKKKQWEASHEVSFYASSLHISAKQAADAIRKHWGIENRNHYVRDVSMNEDASRIRRNPGSFARLRSFSLNILRLNNVVNIASELYRNSLSLERVLQYEGIF